MSGGKQMWYRVENDNDVQPNGLDVTSSQIYNYIRKDFEFIPAQEEEEGSVITAHWSFLENKILKQDWETYMQISEHETALDDVYAALTELAELIG